MWRVVWRVRQPTLRYAERVVCCRCQSMGVETHSRGLEAEHGRIVEGKIGCEGMGKIGLERGTRDMQALEHGMFADLRSVVSTIVVPAVPTGHVHRVGRVGDHPPQLVREFCTHEGTRQMMRAWADRDERTFWGVGSIVDGGVEFGAVLTGLEALLDDGEACVGGEDFTV